MANTERLNTLQYVKDAIDAVSGCGLFLQQKVVLFDGDLVADPRRLVEDLPGDVTGLAVERLSEEDELHRIFQLGERGL